MMRCLNEEIVSLSPFVSWTRTVCCEVSNLKELADDDVSYSILRCLHLVPVGQHTGALLAP